MFFSSSEDEAGDLRRPDGVYTGTEEGTDVQRKRALCPEGLQKIPFISSAECRLRGEII